MRDSPLDLVEVLPPFCAPDLRIALQIYVVHCAKNGITCDKLALFRGILAMSRMDALDIKLLKALQKDGRMSNAELADSVALSPSACHRRVQRLEREGVIRNYVALLNPRAVDRRATVFVEITLKGQADEILQAFERQVALIPDVLECHLMAGAADYLLKVVAQDTDDFARIHKQYLARLPGVAQMQSSFALRTVFKTTALPL
jgi:Lrp/AsnC family leucine-responsive transcriptional regulator